jgi:hypothetical protein
VRGRGKPRGDCFGHDWITLRGVRKCRNGRLTKNVTSTDVKKRCETFEDAKEDRGGSSVIWVISLLPVAIPRDDDGGVFGA